MGVVKFNNISSDSLGIIVETIPDYEMPLKKYERIHVPGRNGDIIVDSGDYENVNRVYNMAIVRVGASAPTVSRNLSKWLNQPGYHRLEDSYQPDVYMMAVYEEGATITNLFDKAGRATITFNRMPQRYLKIGEKPLVYDDKNDKKATITNPTDQIALPLIKVYGSGAGTVTIGPHVMTISSMSGYLYIDSSKEDIHKDYTNMNGYVTITNGFPKIVGFGNIPVKFTGGVTRVDITPNWWVI